MHMRNSLVTLITILVATSDSAQSGAISLFVKDITPQELAARLGIVQVIDVNEADNCAYAHVPGAQLMAYDAITVEVLPKDKSGALVFYCWSPECPAAETAAQSAFKLGYTDVACMKAGITGWQDAGLPTEP